MADNDLDEDTSIFPDFPMVFLAPIRVRYKSVAKPGIMPGYSLPSRPQESDSWATMSEAYAASVSIGPEFQI